MSTGVADGAYHRFGQRYQEILRANGIGLELRPSSGGVENLQRLNEGTVSVAFVAGRHRPAGAGPRRAARRDAAALAGHRRLRAGLDLQHRLDLSKGLGPLAGKRIAVGVPGSGNFKVATELLAVYGVTDGGPRPGTPFVSEGGMAAVELLTSAGSTRPS